MRDYCLQIDNTVLETCNFLNTRCETVQPEVDADFPYRPVHTGRIDKIFRMQDETRKMVSYIPKNFPAAGEGILILAARGETAEDYLEKKDFWRQYAEKRNAVIIILEAAEEGWRQRELKKDVDFLDAVLLFLCQKEWYCVNEASIYLYGIGDGAYTATAYSLAKPEKIAAFATWGTAKLHPDLLEQIRNKKSIARPELKNADYPVAAWMIRETGEDAPTAEYIKSTLRCGEEKIVSDKAQIYLQNAKRFPRTINDECCARLLLSTKEQFPDGPEAEEVLDFLLQYRRWFGQENGHLRYTRTPEDLGLTLYRCEYQGLHRYYYVYEPSSYRHGVGGKRPLVLAIHGYSCTGEMFVQNTQWNDVAEEKDFFVIFPTAYPGMTQSNCTPLPMWRNGPAVWGPQNDVDDVAFLSHVLDEVETNYPIDTERVYVTGHSNGSVMTQILVNKIPERFAAAAPVGLTHGDLGILPYTSCPNVRIPFWLLKGELDIGCACDMSEESPNTVMLQLMCGANHADYSSPKEQTNGKFRNKTFSDAEGRPMVRFTEMEKLPHAYTTEMSYAIWNEYFAKFRRCGDGKIEYTE